MYTLILLGFLALAPKGEIQADTLASQTDSITNVVAETTKSTIAVADTILRSGVEATKTVSQTFGKMKDDAIGYILSQGTHIVIDFAFRILIAVLIVTLGLWIIKRIVSINRTIFNRRKLDPSFSSFLLNFIKIALNIGLILLVIHIVGFESTSLVAILASTGVGIGMAMSGTLQNFAGGVLILFIRPYKVSDTIEVLNQIGTVKEIQLFHTVITTPDNRVIMIPNGSISSGIINNYTKEEMRRVEWKFGVAYGNNFDDVKRMINDILDNDPRIIKTQPRVIAIDTLADSSVTILVRAWTGVDTFWDVKWKVNEDIYKQYAKYNLSIPFPQMDVHLFKNDQ